jgi:hypothetical protein
VVHGDVIILHSKLCMLSGDWGTTQAGYRVEALCLAVRFPCAVCPLTLKTPSLASARICGGLRLGTHTKLLIGAVL